MKKSAFALACLLLCGPLWSREKPSADGRPAREETLAKELASEGAAGLYSHFLNALILERRGELARALKEYDRTLELAPEATLIYRQRADLYLKMGNPARALADIQAYVRSHPDDKESLLLLANVHVLLGQNAAARLILEKILARDPDDTETLMSLATLVMSEDTGAAVKLFERYLKLDPGSVNARYSLGLLYQKLGKAEAARASFKKVVEIDPDSLPSLVILGQMSEQEGDASAAARYYESALAKMPENFSLRLQLILLHAQKGEMAEIERLLEPYKEAPQPPVEAHLWLGIVYEAKQEWAKALAHYQKARAQTGSSELDVRLASIYSHMGRPREALAAVRSLVKKTPDNPQFRYFLALAYLDLKKQKAAIGELKKAAALRPDFSSAYFQMGVAYDALKRWPEAEAMFREAIRVDTQNASAYNYLGYTYADRNEKLDEARRLIERALENDPNNPAFLDSLGWLDYRQKDYAAALRHLTVAAGLMPDPVIYDHMGDCFNATGDLSQAAVHYGKSLELDPKSKTVRAKLAALNKKMVPTSPGRKRLEEYAARSARSSHLSGVLVLKPGSALARLASARNAPRGFFYFRARPEPSSAAVRTDLRVDILNEILLPGVVLRWWNSPGPDWSVFPPEVKGEVPAQTTVFLAQMAALLNGDLWREFDAPATGIEEKRGAFIFQKGARSLTLEKKRGVVTEIRDADYSLRIGDFSQIDGLWLPGRVVFSWREPGPKAKSRRFEMEFSRFSTEKIEKSIFETGRER